MEEQLKVKKAFRDSKNHKSYDIGDNIDDKHVDIAALKKYGFVIEDKPKTTARRTKKENATN